MHINAHLEFDVVALQQDDTVTVMVELEAPTTNPDDSKHVEHTAVVVLDRSGSMSGSRLESAKDALIELVDRLDDRDRFGLVAFDHAADMIFPAEPVGTAGKPQLKRAIASLYTGGSTDLCSGYLRGLQEARRAAGDAGAAVVLLSDGHANTGLVDPVQFRQLAGQAHRDSITTSTIGVGIGYDEDILAELATGGSGNHAFAEGPDQAAAAIADEFEGLMSKTVQGANLLITPRAQVTEIKVLNDLPGHVAGKSILTDVGDLYSGESRRVVIAFEVPAMAKLGMVEIAELTFSYTGLPDLVQHTVKVPITVNVVPADVAAGRVPQPQVVNEKLLLTTQARKHDVEQAIRDGDIHRATSTLQASQDALADVEADWGGTLDERIKAEMEWLAASREKMKESSPDYMSKRMRADRTLKSRGYTRRQGGEVDDDA